MLLISCDWGTSTFRVRLLRGDSTPSLIAERTNASGVTAFPPGSDATYRSFLAREIAALFADGRLKPEPVRIVLSGMITSSIGWKQPPYAVLPFPLNGSAAVVERDLLDTVYGGHELVFVSGVRGEAEVLRGEECELIGLYAQPQAAGLLSSSVAILPGTHSKVLDISAGHVTSFRTFLTGELFDLLCRHSILRHAVAGGECKAETGPAFEEGVSRVAGAGLLGSLFSVRARSLLEGAGPGWSRDFLSGLVIGDELAAVTRLYPRDVPLVLCGAPRLVSLYRRGLDVLGEVARLSPLPDEAGGLAAALGHWQLVNCLIGPPASC